MKTFLCLLAAVAVGALSYWHVPVQSLLRLPAPAASPEAPKSALEAPAPAVVASGQSAIAAPLQVPAAVPSGVGPVRTVPAAPSPAAMDEARRKAQLASQVALAQQAAVAKYPSLAVAGSEINSRFVFRYKALLAQQSARLLDPSWPMQLADECAAASAGKAKTVAKR